MAPFKRNRTTYVVHCLIISLTLGALATGCSQRMTDFTIISSKNTQLNIPTEAIGERVEGVDEVWVFLGISLGSPNLKTAIDRAIESAGPGYDALVDGVIYRTSGLIKRGYKVAGTPFKTDLSNDTSQNEERPVLYHSSREISNDAALTTLKINQGEKADTSENK